LGGGRAWQAASWPAQNSLLPHWLRAGNSLILVLKEDAKGDPGTLVPRPIPDTNLALTELGRQNSRRGQGEVQMRDPQPNLTLTRRSSRLRPLSDIRSILCMSAGLRDLHFLPVLNFFHNGDWAALTLAPNTKHKPNPNPNHCIQPCGAVKSLLDRGRADTLHSTGICV
jgi:hypothetical protein